MLKAFRALIVGLMLMSILVACGGGGNTETGGSSPAASAGGVTASTAAEPSVAASEEPMASMEASEAAESPEASAEASEEASAEPSAEASEEASPEASEAAGATETETATGGGEPIELPAVSAADNQGDIITAGSSTVFPLTEAMAERWQNEGGSQVTVDSIGTGGGFERFCEAAETDIANASRPIEEEEAQACVDNGREAIEFRVGTDALVVAVSAENDFLTELTTEQLAQVFSTATNWSDIDPSFPNEPIQRFIPGTDSGTFDYFVEEIFEEDPAPILAAANLQQSEDDNVLVQGIEGSPNAIGFFGFAYYQEEQERLKAISIDGVEPNAETAESNEYPLSRPLFIYSSQSVFEEKPQVPAFINFYLTYVNEEIEDVGYFPASTDALNEAKQNWLDAAGQ